MSAAPPTLWVALGAALCVLWAGWVLAGGRRVFRVLAGLAAAAVAAFLLTRAAPAPVWSGSAEPAPAGVVGLLPGPSPRAGLAGPEACAACHPGPYATWSGSHHRTMTQVASARTAQVEFVGELSDRGVHRRLETTADGTLRVHTLDVPGGPSQGAQTVALITGSHHLQNFWLAQPDGWYVQLPFAWHLGLRRWLPVQDTFVQPEQAEPQPPPVWNDGCVYCHTVGGAGGIAEDGQTARTAVGTLGVTCEACHGDAAEHAAALANPLDRYRLHLGDAPAPDITRPQALELAASRALCGQCHGVFLRDDQPRLNREAEAFRPGDALAPTRHLFLPAPDPTDGTRLLIPPRDGVPVAVDLQRPDGTLVPTTILGVGEAGLVIAGTHAPGPAQLLSALGRIPGEVVAHTGGPPGAPSASPFAVPVDGPDSLLPALVTLLGYTTQQPYLYDLQVFWADGTARSAGREANALARTACAVNGPLTCLHCHAMHAYAAPADQLRPELAAPDGDLDAPCRRCHAAETQAGAAHSHHPTAAAACVDCHQPFTTFGLLGAIRSHRIDAPSAAQSAVHGRPNACNLCHLDQPLAFTARWLQTWYGQAPPMLAAEDLEVSAAVRWLLSGDAAQRAVTAAAFARPAARAISGRSWAAPLLAPLLDDDYAAVRKVAAEALRTQPGFADFAHDFIGLPGTRPGMVAEILRRWAATLPDRTGPAVLVRGAGDADLPAIEALRQRRDRRPVHVSE